MSERGLHPLAAMPNLKEPTKEKEKKEGREEKRGEEKPEGKNKRRGRPQKCQVVVGKWGPEFVYRGRVVRSRAGWGAG